MDDLKSFGDSTGEFSLTQSRRPTRAAAAGASSRTAGSAALVVMESTV